MIIQHTIIVKSTQYLLHVLKGYIQPYAALGLKGLKVKNESWSNTKREENALITNSVCQKGKN